MAFSDVLNEASNQIRVQEGVAPDTTLASSIKALGGMAAGFVGEARRSKETTLRDQIIGDLQSEFTTYTDSFKQGKMTEKELNSRIDTRLRQVRADNPIMGADIDNWVKEDLGLQPRGNTFTQERIDVEKQAELEEMTFREAVSNGVGILRQDGSYNREATIQNFRRIQLNLLQAKLNPPKSGEMSNAERKQNEISVAESMRAAYQLSAGPILNNVYAEINSNPQLDDAMRISRARERLVVLKNDLEITLDRELGGQGLDPEAFARVKKERLDAFESQYNNIFGDNWGVARKRLRILDEAQKVYGNNITEQMGPVLSLGDKVGDQTFSTVFATIMASDVKTRGGVNAQVSNAFDTINNTNLTASILEGSMTTSQVPPTNKPMVGRGLDAAVNSGLTTPLTERNEKDIKSFNKACNSLIDMCMESDTPDNRRNLIKKLDNPAAFENIAEYMKRPETRQEGVETLSKLRSMVKSSIILSADPLDKFALTTEAVSGMIYDVDTGKISVDPSVILEKGQRLVKDLPVSTVRTDKGTIDESSYAGQLRKGRDLTDNLNRSLNVYAKAYTLQYPNVKEADVKRTVIDKLGLRSSRTINTPLVEDVVNDLQTGAPAKKVLRFKLGDDGRPTMVE